MTSTIYAKAIRREFMPDVNGAAAIGFWLIAAVMNNGTRRTRRVALVPFALGCVGYAFSQKYHRENGGWG